MRKYLLLIILMMFFLTGCTNINNKDIAEIVSMSLNNPVMKTNEAFKGYKIYIPTNMNVSHDNGNNVTLSSNNEKYYLYVDIVSYYNKTKQDYKINDDKEAFYSQILNNGDNNGYILITKYNKKYFVEVMYNYAKIEVITSNYKEAINKSLVVLKSISYNDTILESLIGKNVLEYNEEKYNLLGPSNSTTDYLEWVEDEPEETKKLDEDIIDINETE